MSYLDDMRSRLKIGGMTQSEKDLSYSKREYALNFKDDPSYKSGILRKSDLTEIPIDTRVINVDRTVIEKRIQILPDNVCSMGDYIIYPNKTYLVLEFEDNSVVPYAKAFQCIQTINLKGWDKPQPCWGTNSSYGVKGEIDTNFFTLIDGKIQFKIQKNKYTDMIDLGTRLLFNHKKRHVYNVVECEDVLTENTYIITVKKTEFLEGKDDLVNNIAYNEYLEVEIPVNPNPNPTYSYNIIADNGDLSLKRYNPNTFRVVDSYGNNVSGTWTITIDYNGVPESNITIKETGTNYIKLINNKGYNALPIKIKFKKNTITLTQIIRLVN